MKSGNYNKNISISVFFPCYNDAGSIGLLVEDANSVLKKITTNFEIIVVDDGSMDESKEIIRRLRKKIKNLKLVIHKKNLGYGGALKSGFLNSRKEYVFYTDGDGQYDVRELEKFVNAASASVDVVQGYKLKRHDPLFRIIIGKIYHSFSAFLFGIQIRDVDCDFRLIKRRALEKISLHYNSGVICVELVTKLQRAGFKFKEVGVHHYPRLYGHSQFFNYRRILRTLYELFDLKLRLLNEQFQK